MNNTLQSKFDKILNNFIGITHNTHPEKNWLELEIAIPLDWVYENDHDMIDVVVIDEIKGKGSVLNIAPKTNDIILDDLIAFAEILIETNQTIENEKKEFEKKLEEMKKSFEVEIKKQQEKLNQMKKITISTRKNEPVKTTNSNKTKKSDEK